VRSHYTFTGEEQAGDHVQIGRTARFRETREREPEGKE
jgi:hypothetical protein